MPLFIAALQTAGTPGNPEANLAKLRRAARAAASRGAEILVTPEMFITGYNIGNRLLDFSAINFIEKVCEIARIERIAIIAGLPVFEGTAIYNSAVFVDETGAVLLLHRKTQLFSDLDRRYYTPGPRAVSVVKYRGLNIALLLCYDVEFPENVRSAALARAHLVVVPTALMKPFEFVATHVVRTRAWENQVYIAYVNHDGHEDSLAYVGRSSIISPAGEFIDFAVSGTHLLFAEIDPDVVVSAQAANPYLTDLRTDLHGPHETGARAGAFAGR